jgi:hypothetical protein
VKIRVEIIGLPTLSGIIGKKTDIEVSGDTVMALITDLIRRFGPEARYAILDSEGRLNPTIQVMVNDEGFLHRDAIGQKKIQEGDAVKFLLLAAGG